MSDKVNHKIELWCAFHPEHGFDEGSLAYSEEVSWRKLKYGDSYDWYGPNCVNLGGIVKEMQSIGWTVRRAMIVPIDYSEADVVHD